LAATAKRLYGGVPNTTSSTIYTVPSGKTVIVKNITICNTTGSSALITVWCAGVAIINALSVAANDTVVLDLSLVLNANETITANQGTTNAIHLTISGVEVA
jgi:hypothetical protein